MNWTRRIRRYSCEKTFQSTYKQILEVRKHFSSREIKNCDLTSKKLADETRVLTTTSKVAFWRPWLQSKKLMTCTVVRNLSQRLPLAVRDLTNVRCLSSLIWRRSRTRYWLSRIWLICGLVQLAIEFVRWLSQLPCVRVVSVQKNNWVARFPEMIECSLS